MKYGFLLIDKPEGPTSHDIVYDVRRTLKEKKIGHLGTLDPAASGLLVLAVGYKALKVVEFFGDLSKEYEATIHLGAISSTYDREGVIEELDPKPGWVVPSEIEVRNMIDDQFIGKVSQVPPMHSAVHIDGRRAHEMARKGEDFVVPEREVHISKCTIVSYEFPKLVLRVSCSSGTYIRSLAHDLGEKLRCGGYLEALRRTKVGEWSVEFAVPPDSIGWSHIMPLYEVMEVFPRRDLNDKEFEHIKHGRDIGGALKEEVIAWHDFLPVAVLEPSKKNPSQAHARKVF